MAAAESRDSLALPSPIAGAQTTTINTGTLRVVPPEATAEQVAEDAPPACSNEC
jgi:hypothetical protein